MVLACASPEPSHPSVATVTVSAVTPPPSVASATPVADVCAGRCAGHAGQALVEALGYRAKQAHRCYDNALAIDKTVRGRVIVQAKIGADGRVCAVSAKSDVAAMSDVATCVAEFYRGKTLGPSFPPPDDGCIEVAQPINFVPRVDDAGTP